MKPAALLLTLSLLPAAAQADLLPAGQDWREIGFDVVLGKPLLAVTVNGVTGRMMLDNGTPEAVFLNRDAAPIAEGEFRAEGRAASGQTIRVHLHDAPTLTVAGAAVALAPKVLSGDFGFAEAGFGSDYMGFIGTPMVQGGAFVLDYGRQVLTVLRVTEGALAVPGPTPGDVVADLRFTLWQGGQPTFPGLVGDLPMLVDIDTGDDGTMYLRPETFEMLEEDGTLTRDGEGVLLHRLRIGGGEFADLSFDLIEAGGAADTRPSNQDDWLRLGADFLQTHPVLWNFPAARLTVLRPEAAFLAPR
jgi:hypothetical protein